MDRSLYEEVLGNNAVKTNIKRKVRSKRKKSGKKICFGSFRLVVITGLLVLVRSQKLLHQQTDQQIQSKLRILELKCSMKDTYFTVFITAVIAYLFFSESLASEHFPIRSKNRFEIETCNSSRNQPHYSIQMFHASNLLLGT